MQRNILEYLEGTVIQFPDKEAYVSEEITRTFREVSNHARAIGSYLLHQGLTKEPVVVFMGKDPRTIESYLGTVYSGCYYVPIDEEMPKHRVELIFESLNPRAIICDEKTKELVSSFSFQGSIFEYQTMIEEKEDVDALNLVRRNQIDTDPIYIVFTSGSTGKPKGVIACHRSVIDYIDQLSDILKVDENTIFGNQTPLYVDASLKEVYSTLKRGATTYLIPKSLFMFPLKLVEYMNQYKINTVCWVVSALTMISAFKTFEKAIPEQLHTIAFGSEVFPIKQFNLWKSVLPCSRFINLYGPTEATGMSCYYEVDREFTEDDVIPIGVAFENTDVFLLTDDNQLAKDGEVGEICIRGTSLTHGYYRNPEKTNEAFVQNPLNDLYPELIYKTGDLAKRNERGELLFLSRKDFQIKHMGHRIELGEIEAVANRMDEIKSSCCIFDDDKKKIVLYYVGDVTKKEVIDFFKTMLPRYMIPNVVEGIDQMPLTTNGKINRNLLKQNYEKKKEN